MDSAAVNAPVGSDADDASVEPPAAKLLAWVDRHRRRIFVGIVLLCVAGWRFRQGRRTSAGILGVVGLAFLVWFVSTDQVPRDFTGLTPYVVTLLVLALASQRLRMPTADGLRYRRGQSI